MGKNYARLQGAWCKAERNFSIIIIHSFVNDLEASLKTLGNELSFLSNLLERNLDVTEHDIIALLYADLTSYLKAKKKRRKIVRRKSIRSKFNIRAIVSKTKNMIFFAVKFRNSPVMFINDSPRKRVASFGSKAHFFKHDNTIKLWNEINVDKTKKTFK